MRAVTDVASGVMPEPLTYKHTHTHICIYIHIYIYTFGICIHIRVELYTYVHMYDASSAGRMQHLGDAALDLGAGLESFAGKRPENCLAGAGQAKQKRQKKQAEAGPDVNNAALATDKLASWKWASRIVDRLCSRGGSCAYKRLNVFTEFSGSACAESAVESVANHLASGKPEICFRSTADIKAQCRAVCMSTRRVLRQSSVFAASVLDVDSTRDRTHKPTK